MKKFAAVLVVSLLAVLIAIAARPAPLQLTAFGSDGGKWYPVQNLVEQQTPGGTLQPDQNLWVVNNTNLPWDIDDEHWANDSGDLDPGQSVSYTERMIADFGDSHFLALEAYSTDRRASFEVSIRSNDGVGTNIYVVSKVPQPLKSLSKVIYITKVALFKQQYTVGSSKLLPIPNSGAGGVGRDLEITYTVTNKGASRIDLTVLERGIHMGQLGSTIGRWCPEGYPYESVPNQRVIGDPSYAWCNASLIQVSE